jgi:hypothetical protein
MTKPKTRPSQAQEGEPALPREKPVPRGHRLKAGLVLEAGPAATAVGVKWEEAIEAAGEVPKDLPQIPFARRAAEADAWAKELKDAPPGRPVVRMGRPSKAAPKVETELVTFRTDKREKEALEALAEALGRNLSDLLRDVTHNLVATFKAGQKSARNRA